MYVYVCTKNTKTNSSYVSTFLAINLILIDPLLEYNYLSSKSIETENVHLRQIQQKSDEHMNTSIIIIQ